MGKATPVPVAMVSSTNPQLEKRALYARVSKRWLTIIRNSVLDFDECAEGTHDCDLDPDLECVNGNGYFTCQCAEGKFLFEPNDQLNVTNRKRRAGVRRRQ